MYIPNSKALDLFPAVAVLTDNIAEVSLNVQATHVLIHIVSITYVPCCFHHFFPHRQSSSELSSEATKQLIIFSVIELCYGKLAEFYIWKIA